MRKMLLPILGLLLALALADATPARADVEVYVNTREKIMRVIIDGVPAYVWAVSTGLKKYPTPRGRFRAQWLDRKHYSEQWDAPMPNAIFFYKGSAIHAGSVHALSHGCVHLEPRHAATLYAIVSRRKSETNITVE